MNLYIFVCIIIIMVSDSRGTISSILVMYLLHSFKKPKSGYDVIKEIYDICDDSWMPSKSMVYPIIDELYRKGYISLERVETRGRRVYKTTKKGIRYMRTYMINKHKDMQEFFKINNLLYVLISEEEGKEKGELFRNMYKIKKMVFDITDRVEYKKINRILEKTIRMMTNLKNKGV